MNEIMIGKVRCFYSDISEGPVILLASYDHEPGHTERIMESVREVNGGQGYNLFVFMVEDWDRDLSPWPAPAAMGEPFEGEGIKTLNWIREDGLKILNRLYGENRKLYIAGYSLAGLFALWALYEEPAFDGAICASGSLWFEGFDSYVRSHTFGREVAVYLSLGGKEEKSSNKVLATIGDCTRRLDQTFKKSREVVRCTLEWNSGGHFADSGKRLAKGIRWILQK